MSNAQRMILCAGLQNSGSTFVSWCFLQRPDTNGVLDMQSDVIRTTFEKVREPIVWCKMTIAAFRWLEISQLYQDLGFHPEPLLVIRDVRTTFASLMKKSYGINGTTADEPPLRIRFRRFLADWELFLKQGWPMIKFEDVIQNEKQTLQNACAKMSLSWDENMLIWPKKSTDIAYIGALNKTFAASMEKGSLENAKLPGKASIDISGLPRSELIWLEDTFRNFNAIHGYPSKMSYSDDHENVDVLPPPSFRGTIKEWLYEELTRHRSENYELRAENQKLRAKKED